MSNHSKLQWSYGIKGHTFKAQQKKKKVSYKVLDFNIEAYVLPTVDITIITSCHRQAVKSG